jgi:hypothetical protein
MIKGATAPVIDETSLHLYRKGMKKPKVRENERLNCGVEKITVRQVDICAEIHS